MYRYLTLCFLSLSLLSSAEAKIMAKEVEYQDGDLVLSGLMVWETAQKGIRPGVLMVHDWMGLTDKTRAKAEEVAKMGYLVFAADIYGKGVRPKDMENAAKQADIYKSNRALMRARVNLALEQMRNDGLVDKNKVAVMGYCFGGTTALELARSGADVDGVISVHGAFATPNPGDAKNIKGKVLALHGADDPYVPDAEVAAFEKEMRAAKVDWELVKYGNAVHSFTDKTAGGDNSKGAAYNAKADARATQKIQSFLKEIFGV